MATGAEFIELNAKRLLGGEDFRDRWFDFMRETVRENMEQAFRVGGVYDSALGLAADGANKIQITGSEKSTDGKGNVIDPAGASILSGLQFENTAAITYDVALHKTTRPSGIQINPRSGLPEYGKNVEEIGERAEPDSVVDNGGTITFVVDSVTEAGVSNAGRQVRVFKKSPHKNATTEATAIETRPVTWSGGQNKITTAADLGQGAEISTVASDYEVILLGPTIKRNTDLASTGEHVFLGTVLGVGLGGTPSTFVTSAQNVIDFSLSDIGDITKRDPVSGHIKIDVKSFATDSNPAITVRDDGGVPVFTVDKNGNLWVAGTTTQENVVQVNSSETITDNLTAGDDQDADSHTIKGDWSHLVGASTKFYVDGSTGRVGIGGFDSVGYSLHVTGKTRVQDDIEPTLDNDVALGSASKRFSDLFVVNLSFSGDFLPTTDNVSDIGSSVRRWAEGHYSQGVSIGDAHAPPGARLHIDSTSTPHIRLENSAAPARVFDILAEGSGRFVFTKPAGVAAYYAFENVGDIDANTPASRGFQWHAENITESAVGKSSALTLYRRSAALADPTELQWVLEASGTNTTKTNFKFNSHNAGEFTFAVDSAEQVRVATNWFGIGDSTPAAATERFKVWKNFTNAVGGDQIGSYFHTYFTPADIGTKIGAKVHVQPQHSVGDIQYVRGLDVEVAKLNAGTTTGIYGGHFRVSSSGAVNSFMVGVSSDVNPPTGTTTAIGLEVQSYVSTSGTNAYGLFVGSISGATNNWAVYTSSTTPSYFGGTVTLNNGIDLNGNPLALGTANITLTTGDVLGGTGTTGTEFTGAFTTMENGAHAQALTYGTGSISRPAFRMKSTSGRSGYVYTVENDFLNSTNDAGFSAIFPFNDGSNSNAEYGWTAFGVYSDVNMTRRLRVGKWGEIDIEPDTNGYLNLGLLNLASNGGRISIGGADGRAVWSVQNGDGRVNFTWNAERHNSTWKVFNGAELPARMEISGGDFSFWLNNGAAPASDGGTISWVETIRFDQSDLGIQSRHMRPFSDSTFELGSTSLRWSNFWTDALTCGGAGAFASLSTTGAISVGTSCSPDTNDTGDLGTGSLHWNAIRGRYHYADIYYLSNITTEFRIHAITANQPTIRFEYDLFGYSNRMMYNQAYSSPYSAHSWYFNESNVENVVNFNGGAFNIGRSGSSRIIMGRRANSTNPGALSNTAQMYSLDISSSAEMRVIDEAGNISTISPHDVKTGEWFFQSHNQKTGRRLRVWMERLARKVVELTGDESLFEEEILPPDHPEMLIAEEVEGQPDSGWRESPEWVSPFDLAPARSLPDFREAPGVRVYGKTPEVEIDEAIPLRLVS